MTALRKLAKFKNRDTITVGSVCTGWGVGDMVVEAINSALKQLDHLAPKAPFGGFRSVPGSTEKGLVSTGCLLTCSSVHRWPVLLILNGHGTKG